MTLIERARQFVERSDPKELPRLLMDCVQSRDTEGMIAVQLLARDMYGRDTFNLLLKAPAVYCLLAWGEDGLNAVAENALKEPTSKNFSLAFQLLSSTASGHEPKSIASFVSDSRLRQTISSAVGDWEDLVLKARKCLNELMLSIGDDDEAGLYVSTSLMSLSLQNPSAIASLSHALALRTTAVGPRVLTNYEDLLSGKGNDESVFQHFFENHPLLLDPRAFQVWVKPDFHGQLEPDFVIRTYDNEYIIVEIETPAKRLVTRQYQLTAQATQAISQILKYQEYLATHWVAASEAFPNFTRPTGMVVIGRESGLNAGQEAVLRLENLSRSDIRIVGFDSLAETAGAISSNVIHGIPGVILGERLR